MGEELRRMGLSEVRVEDRRAFFTGDFLDMARANLRLRYGRAGDAAAGPLRGPDL